MTLDEAMRLLEDTVRAMQRENDELRSDVRRLAEQNSELCDEVFALREQLGLANTKRPGGA